MKAWLLAAIIGAWAGPDGVWHDVPPDVPWAYHTAGGAVIMTPENIVQQPPQPPPIAEKDFVWPAACGWCGGAYRVHRRFDSDTGVVCYIYDRSISCVEVR